MDTPSVTNQKFTRLKNFLMELFQLDQPELDFGLYRVMHARSKEVVEFLEKDLLPQVSAIFDQYRSSDTVGVQEELKAAINQAKELGADPDTLPKVRDLKARLATGAVDVSRLESEVYDHLYTFFRRYYHEGDFLSRRVYKDGVYAIPYSGEEVKLHWANADQYYIKTDEYLKNFSFRLNPTDDNNPLRVHFRIKSASEGEHGNIKAQENGERRFVLCKSDFIEEEDGETGTELVIYFEYRQAEVSDWGDDNKAGKKAPPSQKDLISIAVRMISECDRRQIQKWLKPLLAKAATDKNKERTVFEKHLDRYTKRNTFDYFIHKDLGGFLRREVDFYIKNEVMHLDDVENETAPKVEQYLSKIRAIRKVAGKIIDFLAQLENFQKKLWLKKKFVVETNYCITLDRIPEEFYPEIAANEKQRKEWVKLFAIDEIKGDLVTPGYSEPLTVEFLRANRCLVMDTRLFPQSFKDHLIATCDSLLTDCDGLLVNSENFHALSLLQTRYRGDIKCVYIDPPYNTGNDDFKYKDSYQHSSWLSAMFDRMKLVKPIMKTNSSFYCQLDHYETHHFRMIASEIFHFEREIIWSNESSSGFKAQANTWIRGHDTLYFFSCGSPDFCKQYLPLAESTQRRYDKVDPDTGERYKEYFEDGRLRKVYLKDSKGKPLSTVWNDIISFQTNNAAREHLSFPTQKPTDLIARVIKASNVRAADTVLDFFAGSGTTAHAVINLNQEDSGNRRYILVEMGEHFNSVLKERIARVIYSKVPRSTSSAGHVRGASPFFKYLRLESYEDALNNLESKRPAQAQLALDSRQSQGVDGFKEQYILKYMLDVETKGSQSLLNIQDFKDPTAYKMQIKRPGTDESRLVNVDLLETFNWLLGLTVDHIAVPQTFTTTFERDEEKRLVLAARLKQVDEGNWWFRTVTGKDPEGRSVLVIWRKRPGGDEPQGIEQDNLVLNEWFRKVDFSTKDKMYDLIYVNGTNNLQNVRISGEEWKVRLIEEDFMRLMFDVEDI